MDGKVKKRTRRKGKKKEKKKRRKKKICLGPDFGSALTHFTRPGKFPNSSVDVVLPSAVRLPLPPVRLGFQSNSKFKNPRLWLMTILPSQLCNPSASFFSTLCERSSLRELLGMAPISSFNQNCFPDFSSRELIAK